MNYTTIPTKISEAQFAHAMMAVDRSNGDHWLFWGEESAPTIFNRHLWVGRYESALNENYHDLDGAEVQGLDVTDENGNQVEIEAWTFKAKQIGVNEIDLNALALGEIKWN